MLEAIFHRNIAASNIRQKLDDDRAVKNWVMKIAQQKTLMITGKD